MTTMSRLAPATRNGEKLPNKPLRAKEIIVYAQILWIFV
jgi:hypothetical protein